MVEMFPGYTGFDLRPADPNVESFEIVCNTAITSDLVEAGLSEDWKINSDGELCISEVQIRAGQLPENLFESEEKRRLFLSEAGTSIGVAHGNREMYLRSSNMQGYSFEIVDVGTTNRTVATTRGIKELKVSFDRAPVFIGGIEFPTPKATYRYGEQQIKAGDFPDLAFDSDAERQDFAQKAEDFFFERVSPQVIPEVV